MAFSFEDAFGALSIQISPTNRADKEEKLLEGFKPGQKSPSLIETFFRNKAEFLGLNQTYLKECDVYETIKLKTSVSERVSVTSVKKVINPYLYASYLLRKKEYACIYPGETIQEVELFHDTPSYNVDSIVRKNLSWRCIRRYKFGRGVSFSPRSEYARRFGGNDAVFVVKVLKKNVCSPSLFLRVPPLCTTKVHYDTTMSHTSVYVKYRDDEFYPLYLIQYYSTHKYRF